MTDRAHTGAASEVLGDRVMRKVSRRLIPFIAVLFFINYVDRSNLAFAKLQMSADLGLSSAAYGLAAGLFFIGYFIFEIPSNLALHKFGARRWIARIMVTWGIVAVAMAFVNSEATLYAARILLGIAEAGFYPGVIMYLAFWFPREQRAKAIGLFAVAVPVSSAISAPVSTAIMQYTHNFLGFAGWRIMFLAEGLPAVILGIVCWFYLTDRPAEAKWLSTEERDWLTARMERDTKETEAGAPWSIRRVLTSPLILGLAMVEFGVGYGIYALSFFLPSIVAGFSDAFGTTFNLFQTGLITAVPFAFGALAMVYWTRHSDRKRERVWHVAAPVFLATVTVPVALYLGSPMGVLVVISLTSIGVFAAYPVFWSIPGEFLTGVGAAAGIALINSLANLSGFAAPYITGWLADGTGSTNSGLWVASAVLLVAGLTMVGLRYFGILDKHGSTATSEARVVAEPT